MYMQFYEKLVLKVWCKLIIMEKNRRVAKVKNSNKLESNTILFFNCSFSGIASKGSEPHQQL